MQNALTFDVEDYFNGVRTLGLYSPDIWDSFEARVDRMVDRVLAILETKQLTATFFVLGWTAERHPSLVREIASRGHEIATHGYGHELIYQQSPDEFREDVSRSKSIIEDQLGLPVIGYRAPAFSITAKSEWALDIIADLGFRYDTSIVPIIGHDTYGFANTPRSAYQVRPGLLEIPVTTSRLLRWNLPVGGGGYFRLYPYALTKRLLREVNAEGIPAVTYFHPWEFDTSEPELEGPWLSRFRHNVNRSRMASKFGRLCDDFTFAPIRDTFREVLDSGIK